MRPLALQVLTQTFMSTYAPQGSALGSLGTLSWWLCGAGPAWSAVDTQKEASAPYWGGGYGRTAAVSHEGPWSPGPLKTLLFCRARRDCQVSGQHLLPYLWLGKAELPKRCVQAAGGQGLDEGGRGGTLDALPQLEHPLCPHYPGHMG